MLPLPQLKCVAILMAYYAYIFPLSDQLRSDMSTPAKSLTLTLTPESPAVFYPKETKVEPEGPLTDEQIFPADVPRSVVLFSEGAL